MPMMLTLAIIYVALAGGIYLLSAWLNKLYVERTDVLSFPDKEPLQPVQRLVRLALPAAILLYLKSVLTPEPIVLAFMAAFLAFTLIFFASDMEQQVIFDKQLLPFAMCGYAYSALVRGEYLEPLVLALGAGVLFLILAILTRGGIGGGDIKLMAAIALWGGMVPIQFTVVVGIILGGVWALFAILVQKKSRKDFIPYGPPLIIAAIFAYLFLQ